MMPSNSVQNIYIFIYFRRFPTGYQSIRRQILALCVGSSLEILWLLARLSYKVTLSRIKRHKYKLKDGSGPQKDKRLIELRKYYSIIIGTSQLFFRDHNDPSLLCINPFHLQILITLSSRH